jgi:UrcA family protein
MSFLNSSPTARRLFPSAAALTLAMPALAQTVVAQPVVPVVAAPAPEQIVIVGHYGRVPDNADSASTAVGYGDLDLSVPADRDILRHRISLTARYLCDKLGESDIGPGSCRDAATRDALQRVGTIWEHAAPRGTAWVRPPAWVPPYPVAWVNQYP